MEEAPISSPTRVQLQALATAVPAHHLSQSEVAQEARRLFRGREAALERLLPVFENAGIGQRYGCLPLEDYHLERGWRDMNRIYLAKAEELIETAASRCLAAAGIEAREVDAIVAVSSTGLATPSLDARLMQRLPFREDVERLPIFGLGCAGGVLGLARAAAMARARPGARVLLLVVELCALTFRPADQSNANVVAAALFGDGAAAALLSSEPSDNALTTIAGWGERTWRDSLDVMGWRVEDDGLGVVFSRDIPTIVRQKMGPALDAYLAGQGLSRQDVDGYVAHPGGAKVIKALEHVLGQKPGGLVTARQVLKDYGNMSAASVLFVLAAEDRESLSGRRIMMALGPGFTAAFLTLEGPAARNPQATAR